MKVNIGNIPRGTKFYDYPKDTVFVFKERERPKRDPHTGELVKTDNNKESNSPHKMAIYTGSDSPIC